MTRGSASPYTFGSVYNQWNIPGFESRERTSQVMFRETPSFSTTGFVNLCFTPLSIPPLMKSSTVTETRKKEWDRVRHSRMLSWSQKTILARRFDALRHHQLANCNGNKLDSYWYRRTGWGFGVKGGWCQQCKDVTCYTCENRFTRSHGGSAIRLVRERWCEWEATEESRSQVLPACDSAPACVILSPSLLLRGDGVRLVDETRRRS